MADFGIWAWIGFAYEIGVLIIFSIILRSVVLRYKEKKNTLTKLLLYVFIFYAIGIFFSIISKMFNAVYGGVPLDTPIEILWLIGRLHAGRIGFIGVTIATMFTFTFSEQIFEKKPNKTKQIIVYLFGLGVCLFLAIAYQFNQETWKAVQTYEIVGFILIFLFMLITYFPMMLKCFRLASRMDEPVYKTGFQALGYMSLGFLLIFFSFLLDRVMLITIGWAYSIFYFLAWLFAVFAIYAAYKGYIAPKSKGTIE